MKTSLLVVLVSCLGLMGCHKKSEAPLVEKTSPESVIRKFVDLSAQAKELSDRNRLADFCSGNMKAAFEQMTDEQFRLFYLNGNIEVQEFKILSTNRDTNKAKIVYQVTVENRQGTDITKEVNEREVELLEVPTGWLIEAVRPKGLDKLVFSRGMIF